jgi:hypothetical protein
MNLSKEEISILLTSLTNEQSRLMEEKEKGNGCYIKSIYRRQINDVNNLINTIKKMEIK